MDVAAADAPKIFQQFCFAGVLQDIPVYGGMVFFKLFIENITVQTVPHGMIFAYPLIGILECGPVENENPVYIPFYIFCHGGIIMKVKNHLPAGKIIV